MTRSVLVRWADISRGEEDDDRLDDAARERCARFRLSADRRRFVGARALLRQTVATRMGCEPDDVVIVQRCVRCAGSHGAPSVLVGTRPGPAVSISHAGDLAAVAVADAAVGVDIEPDRDDLDIRRWVRTEAELKATGVGLDTDRAARRPAIRTMDLTIEGYVGAVSRRGRRRLHVDVAAVELSLTR